MLKLKNLVFFVLTFLLGANITFSLASSASSDDIKSRGKTFDYFEDTLGFNRFYCNFKPHQDEPSEEVLKEVAESLNERKKNIVKFLQVEDSNLKLGNLVDVDAYPLAQGILKRALSRQKPLKVIDLTESDITEKTADILFTALVNRGICDGWASREDGSNLLRGLVISFPKGLKINEDTIKIAHEKGVTFQ